MIPLHLPQKKEILVFGKRQTNLGVFLHQLEKLTMYLNGMMETLLIGTDDTITVYPEETTTYTAAVTYNLCNGETATVTDTVLVEIHSNSNPCCC